MRALIGGENGEAILGGSFSGPEEGVIAKGAFSLQESLESLNSLHSLECLENGRCLLCFPQSGGSLDISGDSTFYRFSRKWTSLKRPLFQKTPFSEPDFRELGRKSGSPSGSLQPAAMETVKH